MDENGLDENQLGDKETETAVQTGTETTFCMETERQKDRKTGRQNQFGYKETEANM